MISNEFNPLNELLLFVLNCIECVRQKLIKHQTMKRLRAASNSAYLHIEQNEWGSWDIKNISHSTLTEWMWACYYLKQLNYQAPSVDVLYTKTKDVLESK